MRTILIIGFTKIAYMPYLNFYLEGLKDENVEIDLISWKRDEEKDAIVSDGINTHYEFCYDQKDEIAKYKKIKSFIYYRSFVKSVLRKKHYDGIIVLHSLPAVLIIDVLRNHFRGKYILDYRDYTYEQFRPFLKAVRSLSSNSYCTFISSDAFRPVFTGINYVFTAHNLLPDSLNHRDNRSSIPRKSEPIKISFWGFIRHEGIHAELINKLGNDKRFEMHYYGREQQTAESLKALVKKKCYNNIFFHGTYLPEDRYEFVKNTDIINNMYENDVGTVKALGNKYYDGIVFKVPQICNIGSYMGDRVENEKVGLCLNPASLTLAEDLFDYYNNMEWDEFESNCNSATEKVLKEYNDGISEIISFARQQ